MFSNCSSPHTQVYCNSRHVSTLFDPVLTLIVYSQLHVKLLSYPFEVDKQQLLHGFKFGILLHYPDPTVPKDVKDLKSAREAPEILQQKLAKEVTLGRMGGGAFDIIPFVTFRVFTAGLGPQKMGMLAKFNTYMYAIPIVTPLITLSTLTYIMLIDEAVSMIQLMGQGALLLAKTVLKSAFRLLPSDFDLLGARFDG